MKKLPAFVQGAAVAVIASLFGVYAMAQNSWYTPGGAAANGQVEMRINPLGLAVAATTSLSSAGTGQYGLAVTASTGLTPPAGATSAMICADGGVVRYRDDGGTPTGSSGMLIASGSCINYNGPLSAFRAIDATSSTGTLDVSYYE